MKTINTFGFNVISDCLDEISLNSEDPKLLTTISPNSYGISTKNILFREALLNSDYIVLDGVYFALAPILTQGKNIKRNQGPDVFYYLMKRLNEQNGGKVFFLGSTEDTLQKIKDKAKIDYPNIVVEFHSPPFKVEFSDEENSHLLELVNSFRPDILFVGMTCPKQEIWASINKKKLDTSLVCCIGAVFDWYAGNQKEIPQIWWKLRLGWVKRIIDRPEIFNRNMPNIMIFFKHLLFTLIRIKKI